MNATRLDKFCREHSIQWSYLPGMYDGVKFEFYHIPSDTEYITRLSWPNVDPDVLIRDLIRVFDLVGEIEMFDGCYIDTSVARKIVRSTWPVEFFSNKNKIEKVIFNDPATIVIWADGTKTIVKADREKFDPEKGLAMAIAKKFLGNQGNYYEVFKKWLPEEKEEESLSKHLDKIAATLDRLQRKYDELTPTTYLTAAELAEKLGLTVETVRKDCRDGFHPGAVKVDGKWQIPYEE